MVEQIELEGCDGVPANRLPVAGSRGRLVVLRNPWLTKLVIVGAVTSLVIWRVNLIDLAGAFSDIHYQWLGVGLVVYVAARLVNAWEWQILLTKVGRAPLFGLFGVVLIGALVNSVFPANLGDVAKVQIAANRYALPRVGLVAVRGAEAVVNGALFVSSAVLSFLLASGSGPSPEVLWLLGGVSMALLLCAVVMSRVLPETLPRWSLLRRLPSRLHVILAHHWPRVHDGFEVIRRPRLLAMLLTLGLFGWAVDLAINMSYGNAFGLQMPLSAYVSVTVFLALLTTFPVTFGNVGPWEIGVVAVLAFYEVPSDRALAFAVGTHAVSTLFNIGLGLLAVGCLRLHVGDVFRLRIVRPVGAGES